MTNRNTIPTVALGGWPLGWAAVAGYLFRYAQPSTDARTVILCLMGTAMSAGFAIAGFIIAHEVASHGR